MAWLEKRGGTWHVCWREGGKTRRVGASTDKQVAKAKLGKFQTMELRGEEFSDPFAEHRNRPIAEHVADYLADLRALGRDDKYVYNVNKRLSKLVELCGWRVLNDVTADAFCRWREVPIEQRMAGGKIGPRTLNQYLEALRSFCRWCVKRGRMAGNPVADVERIDETSDVRRQRRALSADEITRLLSVKSMSAEHRRFYRFTLATGLRRQETADLVWSDLHLDGITPFIALRAKATKARRADTLPLRLDIARELQDARGGTDDGGKVFRSIPTIERHRIYLAQAEIPWKDDQGRRADLHALRHSFGTLLSKAGVSPREAMALMRHSDLKLTMNVYTDPRIFDLAGAVAKLPIPATNVAAEALATGTDGKASEANDGARVANRVATATAERHNVAHLGTPADFGGSENHSEKSGVWHTLAQAGTGCEKMRHVGLEPTTR